MFIKVTSAEVIMSNFNAVHNLPFQAADHLSGLFKSMFFVSAQAIICEALDPFHKVPVIENAVKFLFSLLCDELNKRGDSVKLLTTLIRFYENEHSAIATRHLDKEVKQLLTFISQSKMSW